MNLKPIKHSHLFKTAIDKKVNYNLGSAMYKEPWIDHVKDTTVVDYNLQDKDFSDDYLTFMAEEDGTFTFTIPQYVSTSFVASMSYSLDGGSTWNETANVNAQEVVITTPTVNKGDTVLWKGDAEKLSNKTTPPSAISSPNVCTFSSTGKFYVMGNIMSLLGDGFGHMDSLEGKDQCFPYLFRNTKITNAKKMVLPAATLSSYCYAWMFENCKSLEYGPTLPANILDEYCYNGMFTGCTSLKEAPALPATTMAPYCYQRMFNSCTSLITPPALNADTLADHCYTAMFYGCTSLSSAPVLSAMNLADGCYSDMFNGCTSLTTAPALPATTLTTSCYGQMFNGCTSLTEAPTLSATIMAPSCYLGMFGNCSSLTTAPTLPSTSLSNMCYQGMFTNCVNLTTAPALPATTLATSCYMNMFAGCNKLTAAPVLPAATLVQSCYQQMFQNCTSLNYIKAMFTTTPTSTYTSSWVMNVAPTGTFVKKNTASWNVTGVLGVPSGWTVQTASE